MSSRTDRHGANQRIARVAVPVPLARLFDYSVPIEQPTPAVGGRVLVPFAGRQLVGICMVLDPPDAHGKLKSLITTIDTNNFFGEQLWTLALWLAEYYQYPPGETFATVLPAAARQVRELPPSTREHWQLTGAAVAVERAPKQAALLRRIEALGGIINSTQLKAEGFNRTHLKALQAKGAVVRTTRVPARSAPSPESVRPELNKEQLAAYTTLISLPEGFNPALLDGVTGSGKTEIYLRLIEKTLAAGRQALVLVPEIALTPQTLARFEQRFGAAHVIHSAMTDRERLVTWLKAQRGQLDVLIGTRSAVLTPFRDLGLIVVDEEHDSSFKQTDGLRYSARDVAVKRAQLLAIPLLLGSATPSFETLQNARSGRYHHLQLKHRAGGAQLPTFRLIDIRGKSLVGGISDELDRIIRHHLDAAGQVLVFLNRRGFAPSLFCVHCSWKAECPACERQLTMHKKPPLLICHHCGRRQPLPSACPSCKLESLIPVGQGTQRVEEGLVERFAGIRVIRIDRDTTRSRQRMESQFAEIHKGERAILVGTQMLAKGHHFPNVTLVAVINADGGFISPDFRAPERTAQLIIQVAGRAGRAQRPGEVVIQTYQPDNPLIQALIDDGYHGFASSELDTRKAHSLPPFKPIALLRAEATNPQAARDWLATAAATIGAGLSVYGPAPAIIPRVADRWRFHTLITAGSRTALHRGLRDLSQTGPDRQVRWSLDIDPYDTF